MLRTESKRNLLPENTTILKGDLSIFEDAQLELPPFDIVIHLAGVIFASSNQAYRKYNYLAVKSLIKCLQRQAWTPKRFLFASSLAAAGSSETKDVKVAGNDTKQDVKEEIKEAKAICLYDNLSIRDKPSQKGKWLAAMSLGETITFTGEEVVDSISKRKYCKIKLTDGKEGWTRTDLIAVNGKVGTLKDEAVVYKRPDLLTKTDKKYSPMDIIAIIVTDGEWLQVKGKRLNKFNLKSA